MHPLQPLRTLSAKAFLAPHTLEQRLALAMNALSRRLFSHDAAGAWLDWIGVHGRELDDEQIEQLMREVLLMSPLHPQAAGIYAALMRPAEPLPANGDWMSQAWPQRKLANRRCRPLILACQTL